MVCDGREGRRVAERWILLARPEAEARRCLAIGPRTEIDNAMRRCGFVTPRLS